MYFGDHATDAVVRMSFSTTIQGVPTAPDTALEEADFKLYKDGSTTALTLTGGTITPAQYVAGANLVSVDTGADVDIVAGADYTLVLDPSPETLGGGDFGGIVGSFSIENRYSAGALRPTVAGRTLDVSAGGEAGIDWANVGSPTTAVDLSATDIQLADTVTTLQGHTAQTGDSFARIGATGSGLTTLSTAAALATAQTDLNTITGADGVTLATAQALYAPAKATDIVSSGAITTAGGAVSNVTTVGTTTTNTDMRGTDSAALASVCTEARLSELDAATGGKMANQVDVIQTDTTTDIPAELTAIKGATFSGATDSLEAIRNRGDAAWTTGAGGSAPTVEEIRAEIDTNSTQLALIVADTNELQTDWANAGRLDAILDSRMAEASINTTAGAVDSVTTVATTTTNTDMLTAAAVNAEVDTALVTYGLDHLVQASVTGTDVADNSIIARLVSASATADWDDYVNTTDALQAIRDRGDAAWTTGAGGSAPTVEEIRAEIDTNSTQLALIVADTNELQIDWANGGRLDTILDSRMAEASINTTAGAVDTVTTVTTNTDMRGTDDAATALGLAIVASAVGNIETDTNELQLDWANGGRLDVILDARMAEASINTTAGAVDTVTTVTTNSDMRGTDSAATAAALATAQLDLDTITGADGVTLATNAITAAKIAPAAITDSEFTATGSGLNAVPWNAAWDAEVESEINDALDTAISELGVAAPTATPTLRTGLMLLYMALRNKLVVQTSGTDAIEVYNDAGTKIASKLITDDGSDYTEAEMG